MSGEVAVPIQEVAGELVQFGSFHHPDRFLQTGELVAKAFKTRADKLQLFKQIGPAKHLLVEGWQMLAAMYHVSARLESDNYVQFGDAFGFEAIYVALHVPSGVIVSRASAMCLNTEENWGLRPRYETDWNAPKVNGKPARKQVGVEPTPLQQIRSMAQTRAESKCLSNLLKWVAKMAGFAVTPADEMTGNESGGDGGGKPETPKQKAADGATGSATGATGTATNGAPTGDLVSEGQSKRIYAISRSENLSNAELKEILGRHGFNRTDDVTKGKCDQIIAEIEAAGKRNRESK